MKLYKYVDTQVRKRLFVYLPAAFLLSVPGVFAQISEGGLPPSFNYDQSRVLRSAIEKTNVPVDFYVEDLREVDNWRAREGVPMPVSTLIAVDYTIENSGSRTTLPGGERIWRLQLKAADAVALMLYYKDFYIPEGGKLFIYSADKSQLLGAYTNNTHPSGGLFATEFIGGDELVLEYVEPEKSEEKPRIHINEIGYGYNTSALQTFCRMMTTRSSSACMVDINCEEGDAWSNEKKSVCYTVQKIGRASYICTASLMNNTAEDFKPLILTARHCAYDGSSNVADSSDMEQWLFYFHREREGCGSSLPAVEKTMTGCKLLVNTGTKDGSDGMLLLLNRMIPEEYDVFYSGWDRRDSPASFGACIHHPGGDYKKISTYGTPASATTFSSKEFTGTRNAHWDVTFQQTANGHGVTESGSSGSPLYNENKLVVGTLTGGNSSCTYPGGLNLYGKMSYHWNKYAADSARMDKWLDPVGSGAATFAGRFRKVFKPAPTNVKAVNQGLTVGLTWSAPQSVEVPASYNVYRNNRKIGAVEILSFTDSEPDSGSLVYSVSAVYKSGEESPFESPFASATLSYVKLKAPSDLRAERAESTNIVVLNWKAPVYEQTIYWGTMNMDRIIVIGFGNHPFYYGQKWSPGEIAPLHERTIKAVRFIPMENNRYEIYITQGDHTYRQPVEASSLIYSDPDTFEGLNTVVLDEPFTIDGSKSLIVSVYISSVGSDYPYPAVFDRGPVVNGKGNLYSFDGESWSTFYEEEEPEDYDCNAIISVVISSERGILPDDAGHSGITEHRSAGMTVDAGFVELRTDGIPVLKTSGYIPGAMPAAFPEVTGYRVYLNKLYTNPRLVDGSETTYTEINSHYPTYEVRALYGDIESESSNEANIVPVNAELVDDGSVDMYPTRFSGFVRLKGYDAVARVDVVSVSGKICLVVNHPDEVIDTSSLSPGFYFFRIYDRNNRIVKIVRSVKMSG
jgi:hypothetical protein